MKFAKGISLFFIYPLIMFLLGFACGIWFLQFFYPGLMQKETEERRFGYETELPATQSPAVESVEDTVPTQNMPVEEPQKVSNMEETLNADTEYVVQERDLLRNTVVETTWQIPGKYMGMNRELFLTSMEEYAKNPPLSEKERGFVGLEVLSFSPERVVVQMNYEYVQPSESFYIVVLDNEVVVLLEDGKTVFINTGILLEELPESVQMKIMQMYFIENEEILYNFLENYSS